MYILYSIQNILTKVDKLRILLIGAGPTTLGALYRLRDIGALNLEKLQIIVLEQQLRPGGLASSNRDKNGFLWDNGGHVVFSHYDYFNDALNNSVLNWNYRNRSSFVHMMGGDGLRRFVPYPIQSNIHFMDDKFQKISLEGLEEATRLHDSNPQVPQRPANFQEWLIATFGKGLCDIFMIKYNKKVWTVEPSEMNSVWIGERVAVPDINTIRNKIEKEKAHQLEDEHWGPNRFFRFPKYGGTGGLWKGVASMVPQGWLHYGHKVTELNLENKQLRVELNKGQYYVLSYDVLISTAPLDLLVNMITDDNEAVRNMKQISNDLIYSHTHVIGIGLKGQPPKYLQDKSWIYFPDSDAPFYRVTVFSSYADDNVPDSRTDLYWSLMCEVAQPKISETNYWTEDNLVKLTIEALIEYGYINNENVISQYYYRLHHGYPVPSVTRNGILDSIQPWLEANDIYSRGRFGGWKYEVGNQDHSFMQGVEIVDYILSDIPEETYSNPELVNTMKATKRKYTTTVKRERDYEIVVSHRSNDLSWLLTYGNHVHVYSEAYNTLPNFQFKMWNYIKDVFGSSHIFLYHIVANYNNIADITMFLGEECKLKNWNGYIHEVKTNGIAFDNLETFSEWNKVPAFDKFWKKQFGSEHPETIKWSSNDCFAVSRERILTRSETFYYNLKMAVNNQYDNHHIQLLWYSIFSH